MTAIRQSVLHWSAKLALALVTVGALGRLAMLWVSHNYNVAAEANGLYGLLEVADGKSLYPSLSARPLFIYLYTPLHAWLSGALLRILGIEELRERVLCVRFISLLCFLLATGFVFHIGRRWLNVSRAALAVAFFLGVAKFTDYATSTRHDSFYCLLELGALCSFVHYASVRSRFSFVFFLVLSSAAVWTRQTGIIAFTAAVFWLLWERRWQDAVKTAFLYGSLNLVGALLLYQWTGGNVLEHILYSNVRGFRPFLSVIWDASFLSFCGSYALFTALLVFGMRQIGLREMRREVRLLLSTFFIAFTISAGMFFRAGGDVNYFFLAILAGMPVVALSVEYFLIHYPRTFHLALVGQSAFIVLVFVAKSYSAWHTGFLPYEALAERIRTEIPPNGLVTGMYAQGMGIHLRGWAVHGPDVTNASSIASNGHPLLREVEDELFYSMMRGEIPAVIVADPRCIGNQALKAEWETRYHKDVAWAPWLCVHFKKEEMFTREKTAHLILQPTEWHSLPGE